MAMVDAVAAAAAEEEEDVSLVFFLPFLLRFVLLLLHIAMGGSYGSFRVLPYTIAAQFFGIGVDFHAQCVPRDCRHRPPRKCALHS